MGGALIEAMDKDENTALHLVVWRNHADVVELGTSRQRCLNSSNKQIWQYSIAYRRMGWPCWRGRAAFQKVSAAS